MSKILKQLQHWTKARVSLGYTGHSIPTQEILKFNLARAQAIDAVHAKWNVDALEKKLKNAGEKVVVVNSQIQDRAEYLKRPDLGRILNDDSHNILQSISDNYDIVFIVSDGLSAIAVEKHFLPLWEHLKKLLTFKMAPIILAPFARVALSDDIGFCVKAKLAVIFIGERPGLTASDSLGIYLTYQPKPGNLDSGRNCISNIHIPDGLSYTIAAEKLMFLIQESLRRKLSGIALKDETSMQPSLTSHSRENEND
jgi:ethanolamine ammonia-lyase small subunit